MSLLLHGDCKDLKKKNHDKSLMPPVAAASVKREHE